MPHHTTHTPASTPDNAVNQAQPSRKRSERWLLEGFLALLLVLLFVANIVHISGDSMTPTLYSGEVVLVSKLEGWLARVGLQPIARGDIIYFRAPLPNGWRANHLYIKRVIGVPGDRITIVSDQVFVNGSPLFEPYTRGASRFNMPEQTVPAGHYFVMGDNRVPLGSSDSRHFGSIPKHYVRGRALGVVLPWWRNQARNARVLTSPHSLPGNSPNYTAN